MKKHTSAKIIQIKENINIAIFGKPKIPRKKRFLGNLIEQDLFKQD